jgi:hypothetical protein
MVESYNPKKDINVCITNECLNPDGVIQILSLNDLTLFITVKLKNSQNFTTSFYKYVGTLESLLQANGIFYSNMHVDYFIFSLEKTNKLTLDKDIVIITLPLYLSRVPYVIKIACARTYPGGPEDKEEIAKLIYSKTIESVHIIDKLRDQVVMLEQIIQNLLQQQSGQKSETSQP